jgi:sn-glycerol 3-phosphate transport system permease protein
VLGQQRCDPTGRDCRSNGWDQYVDVFRSNEFQDALWVTAKFALITVPLGLVLGVGLAVVADKYVRGIGAFRTIFSSTVATSVAVASLIWLFLFNPAVGVLSKYLGGVFKDPGLLQNPDTALWAVSATSVWANLGFTFIVVTAALQGVPRELYESAYVDGASGWGRFTNVTVPMLGPTLLFVTVVLTSRAFQAYGEFDLLTGGGPEGRTTTLTYLVYGNNSIIKSQEGLKAAVAVLLFVILLAVSAVQFRGVSKRIHYS